jgi:hypothetical protein
VPARPARPARLLVLGGLFAVTVMTKFARSATITVSCGGRHCPFRTRRGIGRRTARFATAMVHRVCHVGQKLTITIAQPHLRSERAWITTRRNRKPTAKAF